MSGWLGAITQRAERSADRRSASEDRLERSVGRLADTGFKTADFLAKDAEKKQTQSNWQSEQDRLKDNFIKEQGIGYDPDNPPEEWIGTDQDLAWQQFKQDKKYQDAMSGVARTNVGDKPPSRAEAWKWLVDESEYFYADKPGYGEGAEYARIFDDPAKKEELMAHFMREAEIQGIFTTPEDKALIRAQFEKYLADPTAEIELGVDAVTGAAPDGPFPAENPSLNPLQVIKAAGRDIVDFVRGVGGAEDQAAEEQTPIPKPRPVNIVRGVIPTTVVPPEPVNEEAPVGCNAAYVANLSEAVKSSPAVLSATKTEQEELLGYLDSLADVALTPEEQSEIDSLMEPFFSGGMVGLAEYRFVNDYLKNIYLISQRGRYKL